MPETKRQEDEHETAFTLHGLPFYGKVSSDGGCISWFEERLASGLIRRTSLMPRHADTADYVEATVTFRPKWSISPLPRTSTPGSPGNW